MAGEGISKVCGPVAAVLVVVLIGIVISIAAIIDGYHEIKEGYVGIYYKFGALQQGVTDPGVHFMQAFVSTYKTVLIRPEEHTLRPVEAITKDGIEISFDGISVLSKTRKGKVVELIRKFGIEFKKVLIEDRIKEDLRIFCANKTVDEVYNEQFLQIVQAVRIEVDDKIQDLGDGEQGSLCVPSPSGVKIHPRSTAAYKTTIPGSQPAAITHASLHSTSHPTCGKEACHTCKLDRCTYLLLCKWTNRVDWYTVGSLELCRSCCHLVPTAAH